ncbi:ParA family protein [Pelosinus sp. IPA-1]|uniref:ParA family protein n=1 Tax=Pelosinus sp. IPA-1 TaxID=3029569 RepID=UPI00243627E0|nr:ParA family protein [Pelosinus sp. IPA-1]GMB00418.1 chromosome partitioning protein ParA [Pelosinus sp. IPA-1]
MKNVSILNLKGGVAKTITAINMAHILAIIHGKRVLLIDNDKQGNSSKFFNLHNYEMPGIAELLTVRNTKIREVIQHTQYANLDLISANMNLVNANLQIIMDVSRQQQTILKKALQQIESEYDYCIIDNAPDINISVINSLVAANEVIVPIKIDQFSFDGLKELTEQFEAIKELNPTLNFKGCLVTQFTKNDVNVQGEDHLNNQANYPIFATHIRRTEKVDESTFSRQPIIEYSQRCGAAKDYMNFVKEYLGE